MVGVPALERTAVTLPVGLLALPRQPSPCFVATLMPDGSPQLTQTWVDTDGTNVLINTVAGYQKVRNLERDARIALNVADPDDVTRYYAVRGRVLSIEADGGAEHIEELAQKYLGGPYPWWGGRDQTRLIVTVAPEKVSGPRD